MFPDLGGPLRTSTNAALDWLVRSQGDAFEAAAGVTLRVLVALDHALRAAEPGVVLALLFVLTLAATRRWATAFAATGLLWLIGAFGLWDAAMQTVALVAVAVAICVVAGVPAGVALAKSDRLRRLLLPVLDLMQTIPIFVYLLPAAMLFGLGKVPALLATIVYAIPPLVRLTDLGLRQVDPALSGAGSVFGAGPLKLLFSIELPLALPSIQQGINQTVMLALGMVVVASMIGARGLGEDVLVGLQRNDGGQALVAGLAIVALAIVFDRVTQGFGDRLRHGEPGARPPR